MDLIGQARSVERPGRLVVLHHQSRRAPSRSSGLHILWRYPYQSLRFPAEFKYALGCFLKRLVLDLLAPAPQNPLKPLDGIGVL